MVFSAGAGAASLSPCPLVGGAGFPGHPLYLELLRGGLAGLPVPLACLAGPFCSGLPPPPRCGHPSAVPGREACGCGFAFCGKAVLDEPQGPRFGKHHSSLLRCSLGCLEFAQLSRDFLSLLARCTVILSLLLIHRVLCFTCLQPLCLIPALGDPIGLQSSDPFNGCATRPVPAAGFCWPCSAVRQACRSSQGVPR